MDTDEFTETRRVVIPGGLGITVRLKNGVGGHNLVLKRDLLLDLLGSSASGDHGKIGDDLLGVLGLASTRLTSDQHGLILGLVHHTLVGTFRDGKQMGRDFIPTLANVHLDHTVGVDGVPLVGVDDNTEETRVSLGKYMIS